METIRVVSLVTQNGHGGIEVVSKLNLNADVIYINEVTKSGFLSTQYGAIFRIPRIINILRNYDLVISNLPFHHFLISILAKIVRVKHIAVEHGPWVHAIAEKGGFLISIAYQAWLRFSKTKIICVGKDLYALYNLFRVNNIYIPNAINLPETPLVINKIDPSDTFRLAFLGRFDIQKNVRVAIEAVVYLNSNGVKANLDLYGDGVELTQYVAKYSHHEFLSFKGYDSNAKDRLCDYDLLLMTSKFEGLPGVALEALAFGCKVVTTPFISGLMELNHYPSVYISKSCDYLDFSESIIFAHNDEQDLQKISDEVRITYSKENSNKMYYQAISEL